MADSEKSQTIDPRANLRSDRLPEHNSNAELQSPLSNPRASMIEPSTTKAGYPEPEAGSMEPAANEGRAADSTSTLPQYLSGPRLGFLLFSLYFAAFLAQLEISVVITALVSITNDLQDYTDPTWVVNAYLLTWSGFLVLWSQFGKMLGRRPCLALATMLFIVFSAACAGAQTMIKLIIFRAFQGIGGAGVYNLALVMICESVPPVRLPRATAIMSVSVGASFAFGPLIGGAIASNTTWRWVFILNVPCGILVLICSMIAVPSGFPYQHEPKAARPTISLTSLKRLDYLAATLFLAFAILLITALQEGSADYTWDSSVIINLLVFSAVSMICFTAWQWLISFKGLPIEPMITWQFMRRRPLGLLASAIVMGVPYTTAFVQIPQQFQVLDGLSAFDSGVKLISYILMVPVGIFLGTILVGRLNLPFTVACIIGAVLQLVSTVCFAVLPFSQLGNTSVPARQYVLQVVLGLGSGISSSIRTATLPFMVDDDKDLIAPLSGANTQFRFTGGAIGLGITTAALNAYIRPKLSAILDPDTVVLILKSTDTIWSVPSEAKGQVLQVFADGFQLQWKIVAGISGLQFLTCLLCI